MLSPKGVSPFNGKEGTADRIHVMDKRRYIRNTLVIRLFMYIAVIMLVLFVLDNLVMLELSSKSLNEQGQRQIQIQKKHQQEQIREAEAQLLKDLDMQLNLLAIIVEA